MVLECEAILVDMFEIWAEKRVCSLQHTALSKSPLKQCVCVQHDASCAAPPSLCMGGGCTVRTDGSRDRSGVPTREALLW